MAKKKKRQTDLFWYVRLEVCNPYGVFREIYLDDLSEESQEQVMASIQNEVAQGSIGARLNGIVVNNVTLADDDTT